jgi:hypothetical protein
MCPRYSNQDGHGFIFWPATYSNHSLLLQFSLDVVIDSGCKSTETLLTSNSPKRRNSRLTKFEIFIRLCGTDLAQTFFVADASGPIDGITTEFMVPFQVVNFSANELIALLIKQEEQSQLTRLVTRV